MVLRPKRRREERNRPAQKSLRSSRFTERSKLGDRDAELTEKSVSVRYRFSIGSVSVQYRFGFGSVLVRAHLA